jgi:hypothetical protein
LAIHRLGRCSVCSCSPGWLPPFDPRAQCRGPPCRRFPLLSPTPVRSASQDAQHGGRGRQAGAAGRRARRGRAGRRVGAARPGRHRALPVGCCCWRCWRWRCCCCRCCCCRAPVCIQPHPPAAPVPAVPGPQQHPPPLLPPAPWLAPQLDADQGPAVAARALRPRGGAVWLAAGRLWRLPGAEQLLQRGAQLRADARAVAAGHGELCVEQGGQPPSARLRCARACHAQGAACGASVRACPPKPSPLGGRGGWCGGSGASGAGRCSTARCAAHSGMHRAGCRWSWSRGPQSACATR